MKRFKFRRAVVYLVVILVASYFIFGAFAKRGRNDAMKQLRNDEVFDFYDALINENSDEKALKLSDELKERVKETRANIALYVEIQEGMEELQRNPEWQDLEEIVSSISPNALTDDDYSRLDSLLAGQDDLVSNLHKVAQRGLPISQYDLTDFPQQDEQEHLASLRSCARLLRMKALAESRKGNVEKAVNELTACLKLANVLSDEPFLISQLVRVAIVGIAFDGYRDAIEPGTLSQEQSREFIELSANSINRNAFSEAIKNETYIGIEKQRRDMGNRIAMRVLAPASNWNDLLYAKAVERTGTAMKSPYFEAKPVLDQVITDVDNLSILNYIPRMLLQMILPAFIRAHESQTRYEVQMGLMRVGISLEQHFAEHGTYPSNLNMISQNFGGEVPIDPYTGNPFIYKSFGNTFQLYSPGQNLVEDNASHNYRDGDIVWRGVKAASG